jgi:ribosomal protein S18 acetylase RimI-like enzyme
VSALDATPVIAPAAAADWEAVAALLAALRSEERQLDGFAGELLDGARPLARLLRNLVEDGRGVLLVGRRHAPEPVGIVVACHRPPNDGTAPPTGLGIVSHLYVHPGARRGGLGRALVAAAMAHLAAKGCRAVDLAVHARNYKALALYRAAGWQPVYRVLRRELAGPEDGG